MCQRNEVGPASLAMEEAAPVAAEVFDALRPIPNDQAILESGPGKKKAWKRAKKILQAKKKGLPIPAGVTFFYYGRPTKERSQLAGAKGHLGVVTVAMLLEPTLPGKFLFGLSFCSPEDAFCKVKGRDLATERLFNDPVVVPYLYEPRRMAKLVLHALVHREFEKLRQFKVEMPSDIERRVPGWAKDLAKRLTRLAREVQKGGGSLTPMLPLIRIISDILKLKPL